MTADTPREPVTAAGRRLLERSMFVPEMTLGDYKAAILAIEAEARAAEVVDRLAALDRPDPHKPGEPHQYDLRCKVCGQLGVIRLSIDPTEAPSDDR